MAGVLNQAKTTISENLGGVAHRVAPGSTKFTLDDVPDQSGKVAVITGGSEGIGFGCSHTLLSRNISKLFILSLSEDVVTKAIDAVRSELGEEKANRTQWIQCDMSDWKKVAEVANQIRSSTDRLDILINNAGRGIMTYQLTDYGVDRHMALNHMGHVILTSHLLPLMKKTAQTGSQVRITSLASNLHTAVPNDIKFDSIDDLNKDLGPNALYGRSKLAAILYSRYLERNLTAQEPNILANATHPGIVDTEMSSRDIHEPYPLAGYGMSVGMKPFKKDQFEGCLSTMFASTVTEKSGQYICPPAAIEPGSEPSQNVALQDALMKLTREIVTEKTRADSVDKGCPMKDH